MGGFVPFHAFEASAGSGKTFNLVVRYLSLLFMGEDAEKILALTFTNKAANEMQERIIETLKTLPQRGELSVISDVTGISEAALLAQRKAVLARFLNADAKVMTIDRFFAKILRKFSLHAGLMPNFSTFESQHELKVTARFLTLAEVEGKEASLINLSLLASKRLSDIFALLDELYAKSKELKHLSFSKEPYQPHEQEAMAAAKELKEMINGSGVSARGKAAMEVEDIDALLAKSWVVKETLEYWDYKKYFRPEMDLLLKRIQRAMHAYMKAKENHFLSELFSLLETYVDAKNRVAREDGELSFDDITALVFYLLKERIDSEFLYFRLDSRISHLLLDEFQDTSIVQFEILRPLIEEMVAGKGVDERGSLFLVGDVKQSIYRFRGGTKELFYAVAAAYDVQVDKLVTNYRSDRNVVGFVNDVFADRITGYVPQEVKPGAEEGYVEVVNDDDVLAAMRKTVEGLLAEGADPNGIAVLTATNADGSAVEELLKSAGIEVVTETTSKLINQKNVRALIEYLKYSYFGEPIYARNFFALIDAEPSALKRCNLDSPDLPLQIKKVIETYRLYDGDLNLLRFLEALSNYKDIEQFLFEFERLDAAAAKADLNGVRVLTVHKSKGLEFDHVIVLDRLGRPMADRSPIIYEYDGIQLQNIYLRMKNRDALDPAYAKALKKEKQLASEDALNALYVAFTRAEKSLFVIRKSKGSKFELLDLSEQRRGVLQVGERTRAAQNAPGPLPYKALFYGTQSDLLETEKQEALDHHAIAFGLALHYTLEMMERFDGEALAAAIVSSQNRFGAVLEADDFGSIRKRIGALIGDERFCDLTEGEVHREKPIAYKGELRYIDALIEKKGRWIVLDYKSAISHSENHRKQVQFYKKAVASITGQVVEGWLCYLLEEGVRLVEV
jgi:exodeoxyribonuclease V beta subunit